MTRQRNRGGYPLSMPQADGRADVPALAGLGRQLTTRQRRFVHAFIRGDLTQGEAARCAGYAESVSDNVASKLMRNPLIQQAIQRETLKAIGLAAVPALRAVVSLVREAKSDYVKLEAAKDLLDRAGFAAPQRAAERLDTSLTVHFDFGGSKSAPQQEGDPHQTGKSDHKLLTDVAFSKDDIENDAAGASEAPDHDAGR